MPATSVGDEMPSDRKYCGNGDRHQSNGHQQSTNLEKRMDDDDDDVEHQQCHHHRRSGDDGRHHQSNDCVKIADQHLKAQFIHGQKELLRQKQQKLDQRKVQLVKRLRHLQSSQVVRHANDELSQFIQTHGYQARLILTTMMNNGHEKRTLNQLLDSHNASLQVLLDQLKPKRVQRWPEKLNDQHHVGQEQTILNLQQNQINHFVGQLHDQLTTMEKQEWSDVTDSSSGGESCEELDAADTTIVAQR